MAKLKVFQTHIGFHDLVVAAPSMKAAADAWGTSVRVFAQGFASVTHDAGAVTAALASPGQVLKRVHGQAGAYKLQPDAPAPPKRKPKDRKAEAQAAREKARQAAEEKREEMAEKKRAKRQAKDELAEIEAEEAKLRARRQALRTKFHLKSV